MTGVAEQAREQLALFVLDRRQVRGDDRGENRPSDGVPERERFAIRDVYARGETLARDETVDPALIYFRTSPRFE